MELSQVELKLKEFKEYLKNLNDEELSQKLEEVERLQEMKNDQATEVFLMMACLEVSEAQSGRFHKKIMNQIENLKPLEVPRMLSLEDFLK